MLGSSSFSRFGTPSNRSYSVASAVCWSGIGTILPWSVIRRMGGPPFCLLVNVARDELSGLRSGHRAYVADLERLALDLARIQFIADRFVYLCSDLPLFWRGEVTIPNRHLPSH